MLSKKKILKLVERSVEASFTGGKLNHKKAQEFVGHFKKLPLYQSVIYLAEYLRLLKRRVNEGILYIETSLPLTVVQKGRIVRQFKSVHPITNVKTQINPSLLMGLSIKLSDMVYEDTFNSRMRQLKEAIANG